MVEYRKHVGIDRYCVDKQRSNSNSRKLYFCVQLLFVETNTGSAFVLHYIGSKIIPKIVAHMTA